jgi:hypothetical protein
MLPVLLFWRKQIGVDLNYLGLFPRETFFCIYTFLYRVLLERNGGADGLLKDKVVTMLN